jgi:anti-sigma factor RsiW
MSQPDVHTLTGAYAADALEPDERERFEEHLRDCAACRREVAELTETTARLGAAAAAPAPAELRARVLEEVSRTRQLSPLAPTPRTRPRGARPWYQQPASLAAGFLLVLSVGLATFAVGQADRADQAEQRAERIAAVVADPDRVERTVPLTTGGTGTVVTADGVAVFGARDVPMLPEGRTYQLWVLRDGSARSAGTLGRGGELDALVEDMAPRDSIALTVEPAGGSTAPTGEIVLRVDTA